MWIFYFGLDREPGMGIDLKVTEVKEINVFEFSNLMKKVRK